MSRHVQEKSRSPVGFQRFAHTAHRHFARMSVRISRNAKQWGVVGGMGTLKLLIIFVVLLFPPTGGVSQADCKALTEERSRFSCYRKLVANGGKLELLNLAVELRESQLFDASVEIFRHILNSRSDNLQAWFELLATQERFADDQVTFKTYENALRMVGENVVLLNNVGTLHFQRQQWSKAEEMYSRAHIAFLSAPNGTTLEMKATVLRNLANTLKEQNQLERAASYYSASLQEDGTSFASLSALVQVYHHFCGD